jgi:hypothetical protein
VRAHTSGKQRGKAGNKLIAIYSFPLRVLPLTLAAIC